MVSYELWDVAAGHGIGRYRDEDEALELVRTLLGRFGVAYADDLELGVEDDDGTVVEMVTGAILVARTVTLDAGELEAMGGQSAAGRPCLARDGEG